MKRVLIGAFVLLPIFALQEQAFAQNKDQKDKTDPVVEILISALRQKLVAPVGIASIVERFVPLPALHTDIRTRFAAGADSKSSPSLFQQTRIKGANFRYVGANATVFFHGVSIYDGKNLTPEERKRALVEELDRQLQAKDLKGFAIDASQVVELPNPVLEMQKLAIERELDGVVFHIGFDADGNCHVRVPFMPKGREAGVRQIIDEVSKKHPQLGPIRLP